MRVLERPKMDGRPRPALKGYQLGGHQMRCRLIVAPMSRTRADENGCVGSEALHYYRRYAQAGVGAVVSEALAVDQGVAKAYFFQAAVAAEEHVTAWRPATSALSQAGTPFLAQLQHAGRLVEPGLHGLAPIAPTTERALGNSWQRRLRHPEPRRADPGDLAQLVESFGNAASLAMRAGFAGVELHAARGYLLHQFLLKATNKRTDGYGGDVDRRLRLLSEIAQSVRSAIGSGALMTVNFSIDRMDDPFSPIAERREEFEELIRGVCSLPIDALHFSTRDHLNTRLFGESAIDVVRSVATRPLISGGNIRTLNDADALIASGRADLVAVGRSFLANPDWIGRELRGLPLRGFERGMQLVPVGPTDFATQITACLYTPWPVMKDER